MMKAIRTDGGITQAYSLRNLAIYSRGSQIYVSFQIEMI